MKNFVEDLDINGHLQISKVYASGGEEIIFDDHNIIVSGMGVGLAYLFSLAGPDDITEYQIDRVQVGVGGSIEAEQSSRNQLVAPLSSLQEYGENSMLYVVSGYEAFSTTNTKASLSPFAYIPQHKVSRVGDSSVRYTITLDKDAANNLDLTRGAEAALNEIGLFMRNPMGSTVQGDTRSILVAYRYFSDVIKTEDFALVFRWTINW